MEEDKMDKLIEMLKQKIDPLKTETEEINKGTKT